MYMSAAIWEGLHGSDEIVWYMNKVDQFSLAALYCCQ